VNRIIGKISLFGCATARPFHGSIATAAVRTLMACLLITGMSGPSVAVAQTTPTLSISDASITEGNSGTKNLGFTITLTPAATGTVTVRASTADGTALTGSDYNGGTQTVTFTAGQTSKTGSVGIRGDALSEGDEIFYVNLTSPTGGAVIGRSQAVGTIINDDGVVTDTTPDAFSFTAASGVAVSSVQTSNAITVSGINAASPISVTGGSYSINGGAYTTAAGTVTVGQTVTVQQTASSSFNTLSTATLTIGGVSAPYAVTTLAADTTPDAFSFGALTGVAAGSVQTSEAITVSGINSGSPISIVGGSYSLNSGDYTTAAGTVLAGQTVRVQQTASTSLATTTTATLTIGGVSALFNVTTQQPALSINDVSIAEGNAGISNMVFTVSLNGAAPTPVSVDYATADGTAQAGSDYTAGSGTVSFPAGTTSQTITVAILGDTVVEPSETVLVNLSNPVGASLADPQGVGTIVSDDLAGPTLSISDASTTEGNSGTKALTFTATLSPAATTTVTVRATTANGTATSGSDYTGGALTLTFAPGETSKSASISIRGDTVVEPDETFFVNLTAPTGGAVIGRAQATGTIINDDAASDTTPDPFSFSPVTDVAPNSVQTSNAIVVAGINAASPISVTGGSYNINGGAYTTLAGTVTVGQSITVRQTASASPGTTTTAMLTIGGVSAAYAVTTQAADTTPDAFSFTPVTNAALSSIQTSNAVTISGINSASPVSITAGGSYSINDGVYTDQPGTITAGQTLNVRQTASASNGTSTTVTVTVGGVSAGYTVTTIATALDTTPDAFSFTPVANAAPGSTQTSNAISVTGINAPAPISISGGMYSLNGQGYTSASGFVNVGDSITVQVLAAFTNSTTTSATLTIGGVQGTFSVTTIPVANDTTPDPFSFTPVNNAPINSVQISNTITVSGINADTSILISGGEYNINNGPFGAGSGIVRNGDLVSVRVTASAQNSTTITATLTIGGVPGSFSVTTAAFVADTTPDAFSFTAATSVAVGSIQTSNAITVTGINTATPISITGGSYRINGGAYTSAAGTVSAGQTVDIQQTASASYSTQTNAVLTIGTVTASYSVTTGSYAPDAVPDPFEFPVSVTHGVLLSSTQVSWPLEVRGINIPSAISITGGQYNVNGGSYTTATGTVNALDVITVRLSASASFGTTTSAVLTIGGVSATFSVDTLLIDTKPDPFVFTPIFNVPLAGPRQRNSNEIVVTGINAPAPITVDGGFYSIDSGPFVTTPGTVAAGSRVTVMDVARDEPGAASLVTLTIGGVSAKFITVTTGGDTVSDVMIFDSLATGYPRLGVNSNPVTVTGIDAPVPITVSGGAYSINGGGYTSDLGVVVAGDVVRLAASPGPSNGDVTTVSVTVGTVVSTYTVTTQSPADDFPDVPRIPGNLDSPLNSTITSEPIIVRGFNVPTSVRVGSGATYSINGGAYTNVTGTVRAEDVVRIRVVTDGRYARTASTTLYIGVVNSSWTVKTLDNPALPKPFALNFETIFNTGQVVPGTVQQSKPVTVAGFSAPPAISVVGGRYSVNDGPYTAVAGTVNNGDRVRVQFTAAMPYETTKGATLTIGTLSASFSVSTTRDPVAVTPTVMSGATTYIFNSAVTPVPLRVFIFNPAGWSPNDKRSAYVDFFGGAFLTGTAGNVGGRVQYWSNNQGMVAIAPDYRVTDRFGTFAWVAPTDARAVVRWVQENAAMLGIDPTRIVVHGTSSGGGAATWAAILDPPVTSDPASTPLFRPGALVLRSGVTDTSEESAISDGQRARFGDYANDIGGARHLDDKMPPTLIFHADRDTTFAQTVNVKMCSDILRFGRNCRFQNEPGLGHDWYREPANNAESQTIEVDFLTSIGILPAVKP